jgi:hypothetical protein
MKLLCHQEKKENAKKMLALIRIQMVMLKSKHEKVANQTRKHNEILALVKAKRDGTHYWSSCNYGQDKFEITIMKWNRILMQVVNVGCSDQFKNEVVSRRQMGFLIRDFK